MVLEVARKLIEEHIAEQGSFVNRAVTAERYYRNENDILSKEKAAGDEKNPLRNADNRVPHNFHGLLVNQKASYLFTAPPTFDIGSKGANEQITDILGDCFAKVCKDLCINASNSGIAWIHYWINEKNEIEYGVVDSKQIRMVETQDLNKKISAVVRTYGKIQDDGKRLIVYEIWTDSECAAFSREESLTSGEGLQEHQMFSTLMVDTGIKEQCNTFRHDYGRVPFIPFYNNNIKSSDLDNIKRQVDTYDLVYSGFVNDLEDIQEVIFVLSGYEGTDLGEFLGKLKKYKTVKLDEDETGKPGLTTLTINIPVEAREKLLAMTRKEIFEQGQGVDPQPESFGNASGEALKFMYALLELKAGLAETEFRLGFGEFIRAICDLRGIACKTIIQTWTRTSIKNDTEIAGICKDSVGTISNHTILKNHPLVDDADAEEKQMAKEKVKQQEENDPYGGILGDTDTAEGKEGGNTNAEQQLLENKV